MVLAVCTKSSVLERNRRGGDGWGERGGSGCPQVAAVVILVAAVAVAAAVVSGLL
jgi:hypothetical protein